MRQMYEILAADRDSAYSRDELRTAVLGDSLSAHESEQFISALRALLRVNGVEQRDVASSEYYAFHWELDTATWELKTSY